MEADNYPGVNHSKALLDWGISERAAIKTEMDKLDLRLKNVNSALLSTMTRLNMKTFKHDLGTLVCKDASESHGIDKEKLRVALLAELSAEKVGEIMAAADKVSTRPPSVSFTPDRSGADGRA